MKALMIEDELPAANRLKKAIVEIDPDIQILTVCDSVESSVNWLQSNERPDLIFMDIELADGKSFEIFSKIKVESPVIFITAYDDFAIKAFKFSAVDYLMKPVDKEELKLAIERVKAAQSIKTPAINNEILTTLLSSIKENQAPKKIAISNLDGIYFIEIEKIIRFKADSNYTQIFTVGNKKFMASKTLKEFDEMLQGSRFFRVHNTHLVNLAHIEKYIKGEGGTIITSDGVSIEVSRAKKKDLLAILSVNNLL